MQITGSAAYSGLSSIQSGQARVDQAAGRIASDTNTNTSNTTDPAANSQSSRQQLDRLNATDRSQTPSSDLPTDIVQLTTGKTQVQLGAKIEKASDQALGTLIDIHA